MSAATERESEWDEQERAWMLALAAFEDEEICPSCGGPRSRCQDPGNEFRYVTPPPTRCYASTSVLLAQETYKDVKANRALMFSAHLKP